jgi:DNA polymerase-1
MAEVVDKRPFHDDNQARFNLPDRVTAKRFMFKLIYGAGAFGYANDSDFYEVGYSQAQWQEVIDEFYAKYTGIARWHESIVHQAIHEGFYELPTGRRYIYPSADVVRRMWYWRPKILNYPVQGLGADVVMIARITAFNRIKKLGIKALPVMTVHDSIVYDVIDESKDAWYTIGMTLKESVQDVPKNFRRLFGVEFDLPLNAEIQAGKTLGEKQVVNYN